MAKQPSVEVDVMRHGEGFGPQWYQPRFTEHMDQDLKHTAEVPWVVGTVDELKEVLVVKPYTADGTEPCPVISKSIIQDFVHGSRPSAVKLLPLPNKSTRRPKSHPPAGGGSDWTFVHGDHLWDDILLGVYYAYYVRAQLQARIVDTMELDPDQRAADRVPWGIYAELGRQKNELVRWWRDCRLRLGNKNYQGGPEEFANRVKRLSQLWYWSFRQCARDMEHLNVDFWRHEGSSA